MATHVERIDEYIARMAMCSLLTITYGSKSLTVPWGLFGTDLYYRCVAITQKADPMRRYFNFFPDKLPRPLRHIKYLELLVTDSPDCKQFVDWLHSRDIPTQRVFETDDTDRVGTLRIFGHADLNHGQIGSTGDG